MADFPRPREGIAVTHFIVTSDISRSRRFYAGVLGGEVLLAGEPTIVALANSWIVINGGGPPTDDKPTVTLEPPRDPDRVSSFLNIRVADINAVYEQWRAQGAEFLTPPTDRGVELRCYMRDPDGHLIEVGQTTMIPAPDSPG
jgi:catechol 2,3-dioxygenase-like lactoylglutathione lyase family enzyme